MVSWHSRAQLISSRNSLNAGAKSKLKSSAQRAVRTKVCDTYPLLAPHIDAIIPKKEQLDVLKLPERCTLYVLPPTKEHPHSEPLFWQHMDDALVPHLRLVHRYPDCWKRVRVDRGAIRFVLSGAALMVPGLTSPGGRLPGDEDGGEEGERWTKQEDMQEGDVVVVEAEGKETACCVGVLQMSSAAMKEAKKGVALGDGHYLGDGLWKMNLD